MFPYCYGKPRQLPQQVARDSYPQQIFIWPTEDHEIQPDPAKMTLQPQCPLKHSARLASILGPAWPLRNAKHLGAWQSRVTRCSRSLSPGPEGNFPSPFSNSKFCHPKSEQNLSSLWAGGEQRSPTAWRLPFHREMAGLIGPRCPQVLTRMLPLEKWVRSETTWATYK